MTQVAIATLVAAARSGRLISFPTDTIPALAVHPEHAGLIFAAKQRQLDKPLILMGATAAELWPYVQGNPTEQEIWQQITAQYWPGALTLVLPASDRTPAILNPTDPTTIGIRVPNWSIAQIILQQTGPLATTSINLSGQPALECLQDIETRFPDVLTPPASHWQLPATDQPCLPSTVVQWTGKGWNILRQGSVVLV